MLDQMLELLAPAAGRGASPAGQGQAVFVDCTFGAGGPTESILPAMPQDRVIALDADPNAVARAEALALKHPGRVTPVHANFVRLRDVLHELGLGSVNGIIYDLGLSSLQLADAARGFAFAGEGELDMRLDPTSDAATAAQLLATAKEGEIADIIFEFGDQRNARRIARQIVRRRQRSPLP